MSLRSRLAPFRHADGTGCWTIGCRKEHGVKSNVSEARKSIPLPPLAEKRGLGASYPVTPEDYVMPSDAAPDDQRKRLRDIASRFFRDDITLVAPEWELADSLGFLSHHLDDGSEVFMTTFEWYEDDFNDAGYSVEMTEAFWVRDGIPVAYYSFVTGSEEKPTPPLIYRAEVRSDYRGEKLASRFKENLNAMLKIELHSQGSYTTDGYHAITHSPVWQGDVASSDPSDSYGVMEDGARVYNASKHPRRFVHKWDVLQSDAYIGM